MFSLETSGTSCSQRCWLRTAATFPTQTPCTTRLNITIWKSFYILKMLMTFRIPTREAPRGAISPQWLSPRTQMSTLLRWNFFSVLLMMILLNSAGHALSCKLWPRFQCLATSRTPRAIGSPRIQKKTVSCNFVVFSSFELSIFPRYSPRKKYLSSTLGLLQDIRHDCWKNIKFTWMYQGISRAVRS